MNRLHVRAGDIDGPQVTVRGESVGYLRDVLRLKPGAPLEVFDGEGHVYPAVLHTYGEGIALLDLGARQDRPFTGIRVTLLQGLPKADKLELIVQKAVELGVTTITPVATERSIVKLDERKAAERTERWQRIADEAARQCGRADVTSVTPPVSLKEALAQPPLEGERRIILDEEERGTRLRDVLGSPAAPYCFLIGPEGGLTRAEVQLAQAAGYLPVTLGPRILRTETVGLALLAIVQHVLGDLG
jgi:16S rRNA (uracil1498-N3)-methyltransferase